MSNVKVSDIEVRSHSSIKEIPRDFWDRYVSEKHPAKSWAFVRAAEKYGYDTEKYYYFTLNADDKIVGCIMATVNKIDMGLFLPEQLMRPIRLIRKVMPGFLVLPTLQTGSMETMGTHWWYDTDYLEWEDFIKIIVPKLMSVTDKYHIQIFRDFICSDTPSLTEEIRRPLAESGFREVNSLPLAMVNIPMGYGVEEYLQSISKKKRWVIRSMVKEREKYQLKVEAVRFTPELVEEVYPLYLNVVRKAKEFRTEPVPKNFFAAFSNSENSEDAFVTTIRDCQNKLVACIVNFESEDVLVPYYIGRDYEADKDYNLYYNILWEAIHTGIIRKKRMIDLGLTTYNIKKWLGAEIQPVKMFVRFRSNWANKYFKAILPMLLEVPPYEGTKGK